MTKVRVGRLPSESVVGELASEFVVVAERDFRRARSKTNPGKSR
jgi:hypothetical protein